MNEPWKCHAAWLAARSPDKAMRPNSTVKPVEDPTYRCPGCGELVDQRRMDDVLLHHQHVMRGEFPPAWFRWWDSNPATSSRDRNPADARDHTGSQRPPAQNAHELSAEARLRRYGH